VKLVLKELELTSDKQLSSFAVIFNLRLYITEANALARESAAAADAVTQEDAKRAAALLTVGPDGYGSPPNAYDRYCSRHPTHLISSFLEFNGCL